VVAAPLASRRHHLRAALRHDVEVSRTYEELLLSPEYIEQQRLKWMWFHRDTVPITEPIDKFRIEYGRALFAEYDRRYGAKVHQHHGLAAEHRRAASRPWLPTWLD